MKISTVGRHFREGAKNIFRNGWMSFASASAISISLFILGVFLLLAVNVNHWTKEVENQVEINVYLEMTATPAQVSELQNEIGSIPEVSKVEFVSKDEGIDILREKLGAAGDSILEGFDGDGNPLPDAFNVQVTEPRQVSIAAEKIEALDQGQKEPRIWKVDYGKGTVESLFRVTKIVQNVGLILVIGLAFTAMFLISNTIKLTILARRREIGIMKLVGATNNFIRWPFFIEGAVLGIVGSLIPVIILLYGYWQLVDRSRLALGTLMIQMMPLSEIGPRIALLLLGIGFLIGVWGSTISVRKFLKV
ncbi:MAG: permease-like cell division protein FtsX [Paenibacillaceae bacterium]